MSRESSSVSTDIDCPLAILRTVKPTQDQLASTREKSGIFPVVDMWLRFRVLIRYALLGQTGEKNTDTKTALRRAVFILSYLKNTHCTGPKRVVALNSSL